MLGQVRRSGSSRPSSLGQGFSAGDRASAAPRVNSTAINTGESAPAELGRGTPVGVLRHLERNLGRQLNASRPASTQEGIADAGISRGRDLIEAGMLTGEVVRRTHIGDKVR